MSDSPTPKPKFQRPRFFSPTEDPYAVPTPPTATDRRLIRGIVAVALVAALACLIAWAVTGRIEFVSTLMFGSVLALVVSPRGYAGRVFRWNIRVALLGDREPPLQFSAQERAREFEDRAQTATAERVVAWVRAGMPAHADVAGVPTIPSNAESVAELSTLELSTIQSLVGGPLLMWWGVADELSRRQRKALRKDLERRGFICKQGERVTVSPAWIPVLGIAMFTTRTVRVIARSATVHDAPTYALAGERAVLCQPLPGDRHRLTAMPTDGVFAAITAELAALTTAPGDAIASVSLTIDVVAPDGSGTTHVYDVEAGQDGSLQLRDLRDSEEMASRDGRRMDPAGVVEEVRRLTDQEGAGRPLAE